MEKKKRLYSRREPSSAARRAVGLFFCIVTLILLELVRSNWKDLSGNAILDGILWITVVLFLGFIFTLGAIISLAKEF